jgi:hypothetical protein
MWTRRMLINPCRSLIYQDRLQTLCLPDAAGRPRLAGKRVGELAGFPEDQVISAGLTAQGGFPVWGGELYTIRGDSNG